MIHINLLGEKRDNTALHVLQLLVFGVSIVLVAGACLVINSGLNSQLEFAKKENQLLQVRLNKLTEKTKKVDELENKKKFLSEKLTTIAQLKAKRQGPVRLLDNITNAIPQRAWLMEVSQNGQDVEFAGLAVDPQTVSEFMRSLEESVFFTTVDLGFSRQSVRDEVKLQNFSVVAKMTDAVKLQEQLAQGITKKGVPQEEESAGGEAQELEADE